MKSIIILWLSAMEDWKNERTDLAKFLCIYYAKYWANIQKGWAIYTLCNQLRFYLYSREDGSLIQVNAMPWLKMSSCRSLRELESLLGNARLHNLYILVIFQSIFQEYDIKYLSLNKYMITVVNRDTVICLMNLLILKFFSDNLCHHFFSNCVPVHCDFYG